MIGTYKYLNLIMYTQAQHSPIRFMPGATFCRSSRSPGNLLLSGLWRWGWWSDFHRQRWSISSHRRTSGKLFMSKYDNLLGTQTQTIWIDEGIPHHPSIIWIRRPQIMEGWFVVQVFFGLYVCQNVRNTWACMPACIRHISSSNVIYKSHWLLSMTHNTYLSLQFNVCRADQWAFGAGTATLSTVHQAWKAVCIGWQMRSRPVCQSLYAA